VASRPTIDPELRHMQHCSLGVTYFLHDTFITSWLVQPQRLHTFIKTLRTGDADLRFYITTVQDG